MDMNNTAEVTIGAGLTTGTMIGATGSNYITSAVTNTGVINNTLNMGLPSLEDIVDRYAFNEFVVEHRVQEHELLKLKEVNVDYADAIKDNLSKKCSKDLMKKMTFTKKHEKDSDTHSFRGRVWVFTKEELTNMIQEIRNGI